MSTVTSNRGMWIYGPLYSTVGRLAWYRERFPASPCDDEEQRLLSFAVATDPQGALNSETDAFGNTKHVLSIHQQHEALEITSRSTVELRRADAVPDSLGAAAWEEIRSWRESSTYWDFTHPSVFARPFPALTAFVAESGIEPGDDPLQTLLRLSDTLHGSFQYLPGSTSVISPIEHILESRQGVCQDYAHVVIAIARSWRVPGAIRLGLPVHGRPGRPGDAANG